MEYVLNVQTQQLDRCTTMTNFDTLTRELGKAYDAQKKAEKELKGDDSKKKDRSPGLKERFFHEATQEAMASLAQKTYIGGLGGSEFDAFTLAEKYSPGWRAVSAEITSEGWRVLLEEDPAFKPFTYVNKEDKRVWGKQIVRSSPMLDDEELKNKDPDLWKRVTKPARVMRPLEELKPNDLAELQGFMYPGLLQVKLAPPRKAKPEELE